MTTVGIPTTVTVDCPNCGRARAERVARPRTSADRTNYELIRCRHCGHKWEREMDDEEMDDD